MDRRQRLAAHLERDAFKLYATVRGLLGYVVIIADGTRHKWYINAKNEKFLPFFVAHSVAVGQLYHKVGKKVNYKREGIFAGQGKFKQPSP